MSFEAGEMEKMSFEAGEMEKIRSLKMSVY
jgi:hypothetical protein